MQQLYTRLWNRIHVLIDLCLQEKNVRFAHSSKSYPKSDIYHRRFNKFFKYVMAPSPSTKEGAGAEEDCTNQYIGLSQQKIGVPVRRTPPPLHEKMIGINFIWPRETQLGASLRFVNCCRLYSMTRAIWCGRPRSSCCRCVGLVEYCDSIIDAIL